MVTLMQISIRLGKAYLPVLAKTDTGLFLLIEPIYTADLTLDSLSAAMERVRAAGHPPMPHPSPKEWQHIIRKNPLLRAAKVKNWKEFSQSSIGYDIEWTKQNVVLRVYKIDHRGWSIGPLKEIHFPTDVSLQTLAEAILEDVRLRPEVQVEGSPPELT